MKKTKEQIARENELKAYTKTLEKIITRKAKLAKMTDCRADDYKANYIHYYGRKADKTSLAGRKNGGYKVLTKDKVEYPDGYIYDGISYPLATRLTESDTKQHGTNGTVLVYKTK